MVEDKRIGWLRELVIGDRVCVSSHARSMYGYYVTKITPSGRIVVTNSQGSSMSFTPRGAVVGGSDSLGSYRLYPYNLEEHYAFVNQCKKETLLEGIREMVNNLSRVTMDSESLGHLENTASTLRMLHDSLLNG